MKIVLTYTNERYLENANFEEPLLLKVMQSLCNKTTMVLNLNGELTGLHIPTNESVRQRCPISPTIYIFWIGKTNDDSVILLHGNIHLNSVLNAENKVKQKIETDYKERYLFKDPWNKIKIHGVLR